MTQPTNALEGKGSGKQSRDLKVASYVQIQNVWILPWSPIQQLDMMKNLLKSSYCYCCTCWGHDHSQKNSRKHLEKKHIWSNVYSFLQKKNLYIS